MNEIIKLDKTDKSILNALFDNSRLSYRQIAKKAGIKNIFAEVLPKDKAKYVKKLQSKGKVAMISVNKDHELMGLIVEDEAMFESQLQIFKYLWKTLK